MTLTVDGSGFVADSVVQWNGLDRVTNYVSATQLTADITDTDLSVAGSVSVAVFNPSPGGGTSNAQTFTITAAGNPVPAITGLSPSSAPAGDAAMTLTVNGSGFAADSVVQWDGSDRLTTYVSANQVTADITATDLAASGSAAVTVFNPTTGGGTSNAQTFTINSPVVGELLSDDFSRPSGSTDPLLPWIAELGNWSVSSGVLQGSATANQYAYAYTTDTPEWTDYSVQAEIQMSAGSFGGGIGGRVDPATGAHYGAWIYPGTNQLKLWKFRGWTDINGGPYTGTPMEQVTVPAVGTGTHTLMMSLVGSQIQVYYDGVLMIDVVDNDYDSRAPLLSGGVSVDWWNASTPRIVTVESVLVIAE
jgi:hypothetical protein